jgi:phosphatidylglycerophosphatase A
VLAVAFFAGAWICDVSSRRLGGGDHPGIVLDEIVAMMAVLLAVPPQPAWWLAAFALFRVFDIAKPWPIREADHRLRNGMGIMLDDALAAAYAAVILLGVRELIRIGSP